MKNRNLTAKTYGALLTDIKACIERARTRASLAVNHELVQLYWSIGKDILNRQASEGWGKTIIPRLAKGSVLGLS